VLSWLGWCDERCYDGPSVPAWAKRLTPPDSETPARSKMAIDRLIARREVHLREKTLWRMLYETCARAEEILGVNIEELNLAGRLLAEYTAVRGPGSGWDLHEYRHCRGARWRNPFSSSANACSASFTASP
jgi:integrase